MKKILIYIPLFFVFVFLIAQNRPIVIQHMPHVKGSCKKLVANKDSTTWQVTQGNKTFYHTRKRVLDSVYTTTGWVKDSCYKSTFPKNIKK